LDRIAPDLVGRTGKGDGGIDKGNGFLTEELGLNFLLYGCLGFLHGRFLFCLLGEYGGP
jgi:hypothetical protein